MINTVIINGEQKEIEQNETLESIVERETNGDYDHVAVALNDEIVSRGEWSETNVKAGDEIEIVQPIQGGLGNF